MIHNSSSTGSNFMILGKFRQNMSTTSGEGLVPIGHREPLISSMWKWQKSSIFMYNNSLAGPYGFGALTGILLSVFFLSPLWPCQATNSSLSGPLWFWCFEMNLADFLFFFCLPCGLARPLIACHAPFGFDTLRWILLSIFCFFCLPCGLARAARPLISNSRIY